MDYIYNFNAKAFMEDNLISQFRIRGKKQIVFGDDTWLKLFPDHFLRSDGTTSFFVSVRFCLSLYNHPNAKIAIH